METKPIHGVADKSMQTNIFDYVNASEQREAYRYLLLQLHCLYEALESELESSKDNPIVGPIHFPDELNRLLLIEEDLDYFYDKQWRHLLETEVSPVMRSYVDRIHEIAKTQPELLLAHSYTRYLGDMSGGQIVQRIIKKQLSLPDEDGISFYQFRNVESIAKFKDLFTARMNDSALDEQGKKAQVEECIHAFRYNIGLFEEIGAKFKKTHERTSLSEAGSVDSVPDETASAKWGFVVKLASLTVGVSAALIMFSPLVSKLALK